MLLLLLSSSLLLLALVPQYTYPYFISMPKSKKSVPPPLSGPCPNPNCSSKTRVFQNLQKHLCQKQECLEFLQSLRKDVVTNLDLLQPPTNPCPTVDDKPTAISNMLPHMSTNYAQDPDAYMHTPDNDAFMYDPDEAYPETPPNDFEQTNFDQFCGPDNSQYLVDPSQAIFTNARRVEVTLLKLLTKIEAPLWAFKDIMDWACDAQQSGYKFMPQQQTYKSQLQTISRWVGMEHMQPSETTVSLPGVRPLDTIPVATFDFISQFHSLLSDKKLNSPSNLVVNSLDPFSRYVPPDGRLGECLSGSWYENAWRHMEQHTNCTFMIPIILYIDKTQMSLSGKLSLFPVQMSLSIFTEEARRKSRAWLWLHCERGLLLLGC